MAELTAALTASSISPDLQADRLVIRHTQHRRWRSAPDPAIELVPYAWLVPADPF